MLKTFTFTIAASCASAEGEEGRRGPLLHQQPGHGREAAGTRGARPLGIENGCHRGLAVAYREETLRENFAWLNRFISLTAEATPRPYEYRDETPKLWPERRLLVASPCRINKLVCASPGAEDALSVQ
jgi:hypothetical protein